MQLKWKKIFLYLSIIFLLFFSNNYLFTKIGSKWEIAAKPASSITGHYKYAVVLGGMGSTNKETGKLYVGQSIDRILQAIIVYKQGKTDKILITGGSGSVFGQNRREAPVIKNFCIQMGVPPEDIIVEADSKNTRENATFSKKYIDIENDKILLITSAIHMRRSIACFKKVGYTFDYLATDPLTKAVLYPDDYFLPKTEAMDAWTSLIKEVVGFVTYKVVGYI